MGKLRERRRRERQKRLLRSLLLGFGVTVFALTLTIFGISRMNSGENENSNTPTEVLSSDIVENESLIDWGEVAPDFEPQTLQIVMVGDMLMHEKIVKSGLQEDGSYNFDHLFVNVKDKISEADLAIANQETIMGGASLGYSGYPTFNTPSALAHAEVEAGFDLLLMATNPSPLSLILATL